VLIDKGYLFHEGGGILKITVRALDELSKSEKDQLELFKERE